MIELRGKRALVTGAGRRVGAEIARTLGAAGMHVGVHFNASASGAEQTCAAIRAAGSEAVALAADLSTRDAGRELVDRAVAQLGGLDVLVLSAAEFEPAQLGAIDDAAWDRTLGLNLATPFAIAQHAAPALRAGRGSIVGITCVSRLLPYRGYLPYEVSKAALWQMLRVLALELAPDVRVNMVAPASVLPPESMTEAQLDELRARIPLGRLGNASDIADAVLHLAQHEHMTGTEIVIDGGRTLAG
jgi:pteridine reductase